MLHVAAFVLYTFDCSRRVTIDRFLLRQWRTLQITGDNCWEISQPLYYEVTGWHQIITPPTPLGLVVGSAQNYRYQVFQAEGGNLVGILRTEKSALRSQAVPQLMLIQDLQSGETWTSLQQYSESFDKSEAEKRALLQRYRRLFDRLRRENPQIPLPDDLAAFAPTMR